MFTIFIAIVFALVVAFFSVQNTQMIVVKLIPFNFIALPIYALVIFSLLLGFLMGWIMHFSAWVTSFFAMRGKNQAIHVAEKDKGNLEKRIHDLELENAKLKAEETTSRTTPRLSFK